MLDDERLNCCVEKNNSLFQYRVGAIIIENGCVLLATNDTADYYYSIGGRVHVGERAEDAVKREVLEETGVEYEIDRLAAVHENFFVGQNGRIKDIHFHELTLYFLMKPRGSQELHSDSYCRDGKEYVEWVPLSKLKDMMVFPAFYKDGLDNLGSGVRHVVTKE